MVQGTWTSCCVFPGAYRLTPTLIWFKYSRLSSRFPNQDQQENGGGGRRAGRLFEPLVKHHRLPSPLPARFLSIIGRRRWWWFWRDLLESKLGVRIKERLRAGASNRRLYILNGEAEMAFPLIKMMDSCVNREATGRGVERFLKMKTIKTATCFIWTGSSGLSAEKDPLIFPMFSLVSRLPSSRLPFDKN